MHDLRAGLGLDVAIDGTESVAALTSLVNSVSERAERRQQRTVVVLRLGQTPPDRRAWPDDADVQQISRWERAVRRLERLPVMNISVATGTCGGPAMDLLLASDFRMATADFVLLPPVNDGHFWPSMALHRLVQQVGLGQARRIVMWGDDIPLARACELGLVDQIVDDVEGAIETAAVLLGRIADSELSIRRQLLSDAMSVSFEEALGSHLAACDRELRRIRGDKVSGAGDV